MEKEEYKVMYDIEDNYWWYVGLRKLVFSFVSTFNDNKRSIKILDAGCGTGKLLESCKTYSTYGLDLSEEAIKFCKRRNLKNLLRGSISTLPFKDNSFDIVISLDVLCSIDNKNNISTLKELFRITNKGGMLLLNLPAYNFLRSTHDKAVHIRHRYIMKDLKDKVEKAGFKIERITYRNTILFPLAVITRISKKFSCHTNKDAKSDLKSLPVLFNKFLTKILLLENRLIESGVNLPFGLSVFCVAMKR